MAAPREGLAGKTFARLTESVPRTFLAAVVSAELHAGARDNTGRRAVAALSHRFIRLGRIVVPTAGAWQAAGDLMATMVRGEPGLRSKVRGLWNDVLIALSARQIGATLVTADAEDYTLLRKYVQFKLELVPPLASEHTKGRPGLT